MNKYFKFIGGFIAGGAFVVTLLGWVATASANPYIPVQGGTGTSQLPTAGQTLVGTGSSTYTPATILCSGGCSVTSASGTITITAATSSAIYSILGTTRQVIVTPNGTGQVTLSTPQDIATTSAPTFSGIVINGNVTTTNETVSSTITLTHVSASGTFAFTLQNDGNYLQIDNSTSGIVGTSPVPYSIILQDCPPAATTSTAVTSSSWECGLSQAENLPDGSRDFVDWDTEYYPTGTSPNTASGWFDNARGTSSILFPYELSWSNDALNHVGFSMTPISNKSAANYNAIYNVGTGYFTVGSASSTTGVFDVFSNGANTCAGIYDSGLGGIYGIADSLPMPANCVGFAGYYKGVGVGGSTSGTGQPIFGILNSSQSSNGRGHTAFTCYDTNECDTYNNEIDDGSGNAFVSGNYKIGGTLNVTSSATFQATTTFPKLTASQIIGTDASENATSVAVGAYLGLSAGKLSASTTLASSSVTFLFGNATTTFPLNFQDIETSNAKTITSVDCWEYAAATTTMTLYYETTAATSSIKSGNIILSSIGCGIGGTSTTSFTTSSLPINSYLFAVVTSTAGGHDLWM